MHILSWSGNGVCNKPQEAAAILLFTLKESEISNSELHFEPDYPPVPPLNPALANDMKCARREVETLI